MKTVLKFKTLCLLIIGLNISCSKTGDQIITLSPNKKHSFIYNSDKNSYCIKTDGKKIIQESNFKLKSPNFNFPSTFEISEISKKTINSSWENNFGELKTVPESYNETRIYLSSKNLQINLIVRAYNEGLAFCYEIPKQKTLNSISIVKENFEFNFDKDYEIWSALKAQKPYSKIKISEASKGIERPLLIEYSKDLKLALTEARMIDYSRAKFSKNGNKTNSLITELDSKVTKTLPFQSPWRAVMIGNSYGNLLEKNYFTLNLNPKSEIKDVSWIKPGKVLREGTLTTKGAFACIDFAKNHNMQYVEFDAGWYGPEGNNNSDATTVTLDPKRSKGPFDMEKICNYAKLNGIGVILYVNRRALEKQLDDILPLYQKWGISGLKYGFVRVGTQDASNWLHMAIKQASKYKMIVDVHDEYRPIGFSRTYPNLLTQEGIRGDEESITNKHTLITMFTRMLAGAGDNTICYFSKRVEKMGSHVSQLAKAVCIFSPLQFMYWYDKPTTAPHKDDALWGATNSISNEPELKFWDDIPTIWDETKVLYAEIANCGVIARRNNNSWFIGGINAERQTNLNLDFKFLDKNKTYQATIYTDDKSLKTRTKVKIEYKEINQNNSLHIKLQPNNGLAMKITPKTN
jgi:alpha-glucosidase